MHTSGDYVTLFMSIRNGDQEAKTAYKTRGSEILHVCLVGSLRALVPERVFDLLSLAAEDRRFSGIKIEYRHEDYTASETPRLWMRLLSPYEKNRAIGLPMWARWHDGIEMCAIPLFHPSDVPRENLVSLDQVGELLTECGYKRKDESGE